MHLLHHESRWHSLRSELPFIGMISALVLCAYLFYPHPEIAMWFGFAIAGYSAIANDSIQTLGTFLSSNGKVKWWMLWLFIGSILVITHVSGWFLDNGDIAFGRLQKIAQPEHYSFLSLAGPIILLILTRLKMPVSTTFLLLSTFSSTLVIKSMMIKTFIGYGVAFASAIIVWSLIAMLVRKGAIRKHYNVQRWKGLQAASTAFLWTQWLMQDTANVAVYLPRSLSALQMSVAVGYLFCVVGLLFYWRGGGIQTVVAEKTDITDVRAATVIDFIYALVLLIFKQWNNIPMSTTWVFLGLLAGREIALTMISKKQEPYKTTAKLVFMDILRASAGIAISLILVLLLSS